MSGKLFKERAKRAWKSWSVNYGAILIILGELQRSENYLSMVLDNPKQFGSIMLIIGLIVIILRFKTTKGLEDK